MRRILYFVDRLLPGGIQSFLKSVCFELKETGYNVEILVLDDGNDYSIYEKEFTCKGITVHKLNGIWLRRFSDYKNFRKKLDNFFSNHFYDVVHINSGPKNYLIAKYAKKYSTKCIIYHSHNTDYQTKNILKILYGNILKKKIGKYCTSFIACSFEAGKWMYTRKILSSESFAIIHNPINLEEYDFDDNYRNKFREDYNIQNYFVIGNIGRFDKQKNQKFLIKVFSKLLKMHDKVFLLMVGQGKLKDKLETYAKKLHVSENIRFLGYRNDVNKILSSFDLFVLPSLYEGFPIVSIEAQANGLSCLMSNTITKEALINDDTHYLSLKLGANKWADYILEKYIYKCIKRSSSDRIKDFNTKIIVKKLMDIYNG